MPSITETRSGIYYGWSLGERNWDVQMNANLFRIGAFGFHLSVKSRELATPPASPEQGDSYIVPASPTGAWTGFTGRVVVRVGSAWSSAMPRIGWVAYIEDEEVLSAFKADGWSAGCEI